MEQITKNFPAATSTLGEVCPATRITALARFAMSLAGQAKAVDNRLARAEDRLRKPAPGHEDRSFDPIPELRKELAALQQEHRAACWRLEAEGRSAREAVMGQVVFEDEDGTSIQQVAVKGGSMHPQAVFWVAAMVSHGTWPFDMESDPWRAEDTPAVSLDAHGLATAVAREGARIVLKALINRVFGRPERAARNSQEAERALADWDCLSLISPLVAIKGSQDPGQLYSWLKGQMVGRVIQAHLPSEYEGHVLAEDTPWAKRELGVEELFRLFQLLDARCVEEETARLKRAVLATARNSSAAKAELALKGAQLALSLAQKRAEVDAKEAILEVAKELAAQMSWKEFKELVKDDESFEVVMDSKKLRKEVKACCKQ